MNWLTGTYRKGLLMGLLALISAAAVALVAASGAQATAITLSKSGSPGPWYGPIGVAHDIYCEGAYWYAPPYNRYFVLSSQEIGRSPHPSYSLYRQDIFMGTQLLWSTNGSAWNLYQPTRWRKAASISPGFSARFGQEVFDVTAYRNIMWRVNVEFRWYVAGTSTLLGTAVDGYSTVLRQYNADLFSLSTGERGCIFP
jgi:hypothetical protein